jgi:hypothetical protein
MIIALKGFDANTMDVDVLTCPGGRPAGLVTKLNPPPWRPGGVGTRAPHFPRMAQEVLAVPLLATVLAHPLLSILIDGLCDLVSGGLILTG